MSYSHWRVDDVAIVVKKEPNTRIFSVGYAAHVATVPGLVTRTPVRIVHIYNDFSALCLHLDGEDVKTEFFLASLECDPELTFADASALRCGLKLRYWLPR